MICKSYYEGIMATLSFSAPLVYKSFIWYLIGGVLWWINTRKMEI